MPMHALALPVSATNIALKDSKGEEYPLVLGTDTFNRAGEDGNIPIVPLNGGCEFQGSSLPAEWHKGWDVNIDTFTATIDSGTLRLTGVAAVAGTGGNGWINSHHPAPLLDGLEYTVSLEVPVDDTGGTANRDIKLAHFIKQDKDELQPDSDNNYLQIEVDVDETGLIMYLRKEVNGVNTTLDSGYDYTMDGSRSTGNLEATIWRLVFNGKPGTPGATLSVYLKQSDTLANAETATENELDGSPYDISDLAFVIGYPSYRIYTQNATYFGATYDNANRAASTYLRVNYDGSPFKVHYDFTPADYGEGDVELWDGDPDSGGVRVYDEDHEFANDPYIQNGLIRLWLDEGTLEGFNLLYYTGAAWVEPHSATACWLDGDSKSLNYVVLKSINYVSPEKIIIKARFLDSAVINEDYYLDATLTMNRGSYYLEISFTKVFPTQLFRLNYYGLAGDKYRFGYIGNNEIGDDDVNKTGTNTTYTDNFMVAFDDMKQPVLMVYISENHPTTSFSAADGGWLRKINISDGSDVPITDYIGFSPFSLVANLFEEAEDATLGGGATAVADAGASGGQAALLDAQTEYVRYDFTAGTDLPSGRYLAVVRVRDLNQVADDVELKITNFTDTEQRGEQGEPVNFQAAAAYAYYSEFFDITDADAAGTDAMRITVTKDQAAANDIYVDYILIIPIGDGYNLPQDLAHSSLRGITQLPRLCER